MLTPVARIPGLSPLRTKRLPSFQPLVVAGVLAASLLGARMAQAGVCVELDLSQDTLAESDQRSARALLEQAVANNGIPVVREGCTEIYRVYHLRLGQAVSVFLSTPRGNQQGQAARIEELPAVYDQMVRSILSGRSMTGSNDTVTRHTVTQQQASPRRVEADGVKYARLGYGSILGAGASNGPAFGFGYRYELDTVGIDVSIFNLLVDTGEDHDGAGVSGSWIKLQGLYFFDPISNGSFYAGAGASWGLTAVEHRDGTYIGTGLQAELSFGYEFLRASTIRMFAQLDTTLPLYLADREITSTSGADETWAPHLVLSIGIGWGRGLTRVQLL